MGKNGSANALKQGAIETVSFTNIERFVWPERSYYISRDTVAAFNIIQAQWYLKSFSSFFSAHSQKMVWAALFYDFEVAPICYVDIAWTGGGGALTYAYEQYLCGILCPFHSSSSKSPPSCREVMTSERGVGLLIISMFLESLDPDYVFLFREGQTAADFRRNWGLFFLLDTFFVSRSGN